MQTISLAPEHFFIDPADLDDYDSSEPILVQLHLEPGLDGDADAYCDYCDDSLSYPALTVLPYSISPAGPSGSYDCCLSHFPQATRNLILSQA